MLNIPNSPFPKSKTMNTNLLAIVLLTAFLVIYIGKRLYTAYLLTNLVKQQQLQERLQLFKPS